MTREGRSERRSEKVTKLYNRSEYKSVRKNLRNNSTEAEIILWKYIRCRKLGGYKFRRQYGIYKFVLDFYCPEKRLGIELDGSVHGNEKQKKYDIERQKIIESFNICVLRFYNSDVIDNIDGLLII